jgi:putative Mg2+ transporter-C (MgtC) family protein
MVGVGFYPAAILLALLSATCMMWVSRLENWLPSRQAVAVVLQFKQGYAPSETTLRERALAHGYEIASGSLSINFKDGMPEWKFVAIALGKGKGAPMTALAEELTGYDGVVNFFLSHARN